jgi:hypothetical protein
MLSAGWSRSRTNEPEDSGREQCTAKTMLATGDAGIAEERQKAYQGLKQYLQW